MEPQFIATGYVNWKDALVKKRGFAAHQNSVCHKEAVDRVITIPATTGDVGEQLDSSHATEKAVARQALLKILSNIRFLARQALPLRGEGIGELNGNFNQLYRLRGEDNPFMMEWMKRKGSNYMHHEMQNRNVKSYGIKNTRRCHCGN